MRILTVAAMATSLFAADISAATKIKANLFSNGADESISLMKETNDSHDYANPNFSMSIGDDKAGATVKITTDGGNLNAAQTTQTIWFKPVDAVKVTLGHVGAKSIFNPQFGWWAQTANMWSHGYQCDVTVDALSFTAVLAGGEGGYWFDASKAGFNKVGNFWVDAKYSASIGSLQAFVTKGATVGAHGYSNWATSPLAIGVAYANMPYLQTGYGADVVLSFKDNGSNGVEFQGIDAQIGGQFGMNGMLIQLTNLVQYRDAFKYGFELKARYGIGAFEP